MPYATVIAGVGITVAMRTFWPRVSVLFATVITRRTSAEDG
jgi:hypothetical protein